MCLLEDFNWYYSSTYVVVERDGKKLPFYVHDVSHEGGRSSLGYDDDNLSSLVFRGVIHELGRGSREFEISYDDSSLVLENPDVGWFVKSDVLKWNAIKPNRTVKKGVCNRRLTISFDCHKSAYYLFNPEDIPESKGRILNKDLAVVDNSLLYKGDVVGSFSGNTVTLDRDAGYLQHLLSGLVEETISVAEG